MPFALEQPPTKALLQKSVLGLTVSVLRAAGSDMVAHTAVHSSDQEHLIIQTPTVSETGRRSERERAWSEHLIAVFTATLSLSFCPTCTRTHTHTNTLFSEDLMLPPTVGPTLT